MAEMKAGYKKTDIGIIPEDWDALPLEKVARVRGGKRLPKGKALTDVANSHPYIRVLDMKKGSVDISEIRYVPDDVFPEIKNYTIYSSDLFISVAGTLGIIGRVPEILDGANLTENANRICDLKINRDFLFYYLCSEKIQNQIQSMQTVGAQPKLALGRIEKFIIPTPPQESEQKAIASALSDVDGLIEALSQLITKKRDMKTAAMQQLLTGQKRLLGFGGELEELTLGDVCSEINDGTHYTPTYVPEGVPFYSVENVTANDFVNVKYITQEEHNLLIKRCRPEIGDILLTRIGSIGDTRLIDWDVDASIYVSLALLKTNQKAESAYVYEYTKSSFFIKDIEARSLLNATPKKINIGDIKGVAIKCPKSRDEQLTIAKILSDMQAEIDTLEQRLGKARSLKTGMMQELLTGKTRLIKTDKKQEAA